MLAINKVIYVCWSSIGGSHKSIAGYYVAIYFKDIWLFNIYQGHYSPNDFSRILVNYPNLKKLCSKIVN